MHHNEQKDKYKTRHMISLEPQLSIQLDFLLSTSYNPFFSAVIVIDP